MRKLTEQEMQTLAKHEQNLHSAVFARWSRAMSRASITEIKDVYEAVTNTKRQMNMSCGSCVLSLLTDMGRIYFDQKEASTRKVTKTKTSKAKVSKVKVEAAQ